MKIQLKHITTDITNDQELIDGLALKYDVSNPSGFETPAELNTRDTNNRARANHTGTQLATTISDFVAKVLSSLLTGLSTATNTVITASDSVLSALGKLQAQATAIKITADAVSTNYNAHTGSGGGVHAAATTSVNGFLSASDKTKINYLSEVPQARSMIPMCVIPYTASQTSFTTIGTPIPYIWRMDRAGNARDLTIVLEATVGNRNLEVRLYNLGTGLSIGDSATLTSSGYYVFDCTLPIDDGTLVIQARKTSGGGTSPTLKAAQLEYDTI